MHSTMTAGMPPQLRERSEIHRAVVAELAAAIDHVGKSLRLMDEAIASDHAIDEAHADEVIVLDDVTPAYARAHAALRECSARLEVALHLLQSSPIADVMPVGAGHTSAHRPASI